ncbi:TPA: hypothetical protein HA361_05130 [Candidatus Woesearchaeota archaeon]|nr:hypothetical protein [Candidatus Woesearchaeota archaeon]HII68348.1 hypothetical protein [Candidatus Woesearchaeota archaeon]
MARFAPEQANGLWNLYKQEFFQDYGIIGGFGEWPIGIDKGADIDSGPIVNGIGAAATAFGIASAKHMGDMNTYNKLVRTLHVWYSTANFFPENEKLTSGLLAASIRFSATKH